MKIARLVTGLLRSSLQRKSISNCCCPRKSFFNVVAMMEPIRVNKVWSRTKRGECDHPARCSLKWCFAHCLIERLISKVLLRSMTMYKYEAVVDMVFKLVLAVACIGIWTHAAVTWASVVLS